MKSPSSIFNFSTLDLKGIVPPKGVLLAMGIVLAIEVGLHVAAPALPDPVLWGEADTSAKMAQVLACSAHEKTPLEVLIVGPSHAETGICPAAMMESVPEYRYSTYNGGMNGRTYSVLDFVSAHVYEPVFHPRCVVLCMSPIIVNRYNEWMERNTSEFFAAPAPKAIISKGLGGVWRRILTNHVYLYRYRQRQWHLADGCVGTARPIDRKGYRSLSGEYTDEDRTALQRPAHPYQQVMKAFEFGGPSAEAFVRLVARLTEAHVSVVVVNMPFRPELLTISPTGASDYDDYLTHLHGSTQAFVPAGARSAGTAFRKSALPTRTKESM